MDFALKALNWFFWGLFMSIGWAVGNNLIGLLGSLLHR